MRLIQRLERCPGCGRRSEGRGQHPGYYFLITCRLCGAPTFCNFCVSPGPVICKTCRGEA